MISEPELQEGKEYGKRSRRLSADEISAYANLSSFWLPSVIPFGL